MSRAVGPFLTFMAGVLVSVVCAAQTPPTLPPGFPQPPRDISTQPATAIIRGRVFDASNGQPLRKAQVRATSPELRENRVAITDNSGAYEIKNLAAGRYLLNASSNESTSACLTAPSSLDMSWTKSASPRRMFRCRSCDTST